MATETTFTLDEAWQTAEAALPEWWALRSLIRVPGVRGQPDRWEAVAHRIGNQGMHIGRGATPANALVNLAKTLRDQAPR